MAYTPETFSTVRIHRSALGWAARAMAYAAAASDHGLPPVAIRMRLYIRSPPRLHPADEASRATVWGTRALQPSPRCGTDSGRRAFPKDRPSGSGTLKL